MIIRELEIKDIEATVNLWYETSVLAHDFIASDYWEKNKIVMASNYLPNSECYLALEENEICGFVAMVNDFLAAIFVDHKKQGKGYGKELLNFIKSKRTKIDLKAYKKNTRTVEFYKKQGFVVQNESIDEETGELEYLMEWTK